MFDRERRASHKNASCRGKELLLLSLGYVAGLTGNTLYAFIRIPSASKRSATNFWEGFRTAAGAWVRKGSPVLGVLLIE